MELQELKRQAQRGEIELAYVDESGFAQTQPNRSAWTEKGEQHMIEAKRGKRLNVLGALLSSGRLFAARFWETTTALMFAGFLGLLLEQVSKPLVVVLDNASVHTAKQIQPLLDVLKLRGLRLYFLPPYSPELNRIEKLWYTMKYQWLPFKTRNPQELESDVEAMVDGFGSKYLFGFY